MPPLRHRVRDAATAAVLVQQPVRRLPDLPRVRQHHRAGHGSGRSGSVEVDQPGRHRTVEQAPLSRAARGAQTGGAQIGHQARRPLVGVDRRRAHVRDRGRWRLRRDPRLLPVARAEEVQGARPRVLEPLSRLPHLPRLRRCAASPRGTRRSRGRPDDRRRVGAHGARGTAVLRDPRARREGSRGGRQGAARNPAPPVVSRQRRARLPDARSALVHAVGRRIAAHQPRDVARLGARRDTLCTGRAVHRPAFARQPAAHRYPAAAPRPGQHRDRRRARRRHDSRGGPRRRYRPRRGRAGREGRVLGRSPGF